MQPGVRMILDTVCFFASGIAAVIALTLGFRHSPLVGEYSAGQPQDLQHARRNVDGLRKFRPGIALPRILQSQISNAPFVSKYLNYTNATVTSDTNICSSVGMYVMQYM